MKDKEKTEIILKALKKYYSSWGRGRTNICFPELRLGSGYCGVAQRRIDFFVISSNAGNETTAFEIKVSRGDFKHDVNDDMKQRGARLYANNFYYVTPKGLVKPEEVPLWAGLMELDINSESDIEGAYFKEIVPAPLFPKAVPSWGLICSMIRHINKETGSDYVEMCNLKDKIYKQKQKIEKYKNILDEITPKWTKDMDEHIFWKLQWRNQ